ncbi:MAG: hypothetical protein ACK4S4_14825 [Pyrinomonadaceae bacterium]
MSFYSAPSAAAPSLNEEECRSAECRQALAAARRATARYHDIERAIADGFVPLSPCVSVPGLGTMGIHYGNIGRITNPDVNPARPEVLLYLPDEAGEMRLVAVEYVVPAPLVPAAPVLFGQTFEYSPGRNAYELHVWAWRHNPAGMFAPFNPSLECP